MNIRNKIINENGNLIADASTIIYLDKLKLLRCYADFKQLLIPKAILKELNQKQTTTDYRQYVETITDTRPGPSPHKTETLNYPDRLLIISYQQIRADGILTDDGKVCRFCKENNIPYLNTPMCLFSLAINNKISIEKYYEKLAAVYKIGRYSKGIKEFMNGISERYIDNV